MGTAALQSRQDALARRAPGWWAGAQEEADLLRGPQRWLLWCSGPAAQPSSMRVELLGSCVAKGTLIIKARAVVAEFSRR